MTEPTPPVPEAIMPPPPAYKDRSVGLVVFGVLTILLGVGSFMMVPLMLLGQFMNAHNPNAPAPSFAMLLPGFLMYAGMAVILIWLGIGSIKKRRWARALLLVFAWSWLAMGIIAGAALMAFLPKFAAAINSKLPAGQPKMPPEAMTAMMIVSGLTLGFIFILIPAVWVFFYGSRHVKATCEVRDPVPRWTDACPLPVLAISLWIWVGVPMFVLMPFIYHGVAPFFGIFIQGVPGGLFYLLLAVIWAWAARGLYRLDIRAWWVLLVVFVLFSLSSLLTYAHHNMAELYQRMGYPAAQIKQMQKSGFVNDKTMLWMTACWSLPFLGYLLFVKKYLRAKK